MLNKDCTQEANNRGSKTYQYMYTCVHYEQGTTHGQCKWI